MCGFCGIEWIWGVKCDVWLKVVNMKKNVRVCKICDIDFLIHELYEMVRGSLNGPIYISIIFHNICTQ